MDFGLLSHKQSGTTEPTYENFDGSSKRERSDLFDDDDLRFSKMPYELRQSDLTAKKCGEVFASLGRSNNVVWPSLSVDGQKMLSFASSDQPPQYFGNDSSSRSIAFSIPQDEHRGGGIPSEATRGQFSRIKSPFTPSQWMELENQAWIYKYLSANVPVPQSLLVPLRGSIYSQGSPGSFPPNLFGWDMPFPLGLLGSKDPEPGRCRRTDGKKWRCSREAVPDQKYCERHINRGRHRSRKPVEASQSNGHVIGGSSTTDIAPVNAGRPSTDPSLKFAPMVISNGGGSNGLAILETLSPSIDLKPKEFTFGGATHMDFGLLSSNPLLSPQRIPYTTNAAAATNLNPYWQEGPKYDWTQLSMSIPDSSSQHGLSSVHGDRALLEPVHEKNWSGFPSIGGPLGEAMIIGSNVLYKSSP